MTARKRFANRLLRWHAEHGRHDLPWQHPRTAYRVWVSEIMLQQTQVATVIPYYARFMARFPEVGTLASAKLDDVLALWAGLGYYARARNLHRAAQVIVADHGGEFPRDFDAVMALPGIGRSTAGAILAQAFGARHAILDGNARRVFARHAGIAGWPGSQAVQNKLWRAAEARLPEAKLVDYTQGLMDLGATLCVARAPRCAECPVATDCVALKQDAVHRLPTPRLAKARPLRAARLLLIENARGELLLQRRPERGIWGGLWCPPVRESRALPRGLRKLGELPAIRHGFTHYELTLTPVRLRAYGGRFAGEWVAREALRTYGLPAPVKKLLACHCS
ncbi:MAG TPA: A/G-specific adenine glycosylase [Verrucomicrobiae bacterium]|nr:A/G-specific adenine glycosylase [Verrucomicrobiae bacterium]